MEGDNSKITLEIFYKKSFQRILRSCDSGWSEFPAGNLTGIFQAYAGRTKTVSSESQEQISFLNATLDDVKLLVSTLPTSKDECKSGSWETFVNVNTGAQISENEGDCVSFVATKGKNPPANF